MMELRWKNTVTKAVGIAFVTDNEAEVLEAMGYFHDGTEDVTDEDGTYVEIWKPIIYKEVDGK